MTYYIANMPYSDGDISHYGIKGMKWGVRRTPEQLGHRTGRLSLRRKKPTHDELIKSTNARKLYKNRSQLSDKELQDRINRISNERRLKDLARTPKAREGKKSVFDILNKSSDVMIGAVATGLGIYAAKKLVEQMIGPDAAQFIRMPKK